MNARVEEIIAELAEALTDGVSPKHSLELARDYATRLLDAAAVTEFDPKTMEPIGEMTALREHREMMER